MQELIEAIKTLKKEKDICILAHFYTSSEVQEIADYIGDSFELSKISKMLFQNTILLCGVNFMGESIKIMNPDKKVLLADLTAHCPMASMITKDKILKVREQYDDLAVVCYINSKAELKAYSDICVTSANALKVVKALPQKNIFFIPDEYLARNIAKHLPNKNFIYNNGYCYVHKEITPEKIIKAKNKYPIAKVLIHPECTPKAVEMAHFEGSTSAILSYAKQSLDNEFIICTEEGILTQLRKQIPSKIFHSISDDTICSSMKKITLDKILYSLKNELFEVNLLPTTADNARESLEKMMTIG